MRTGGLAVLALLGACTAAAPDPNAAPRWSGAQIASLKQWAAAAPLEGLPAFSTAALDAAGGVWDTGEADRTATGLALKLANAHLHGCANAVERGGWRIPDDAKDSAIEPKLRAALARSDNLDGFFAGIKPSHPGYAALQAAFVAETDPGCGERASAGGPG